MTPIVIGAGPAGLTAAYELCRRGFAPVVFEAGPQVGGIARTINHRGYRFDVGGHRFFTKIREVEAIWRELLGDDFLEVDRLSRIYYRGRFFRYPLEPVSTLRQLGLGESLRVAASFVLSTLRRPADTTSLEGWVTARFGRRLYETFFATYTEKVWGIPGSEIRAEWAAQRIRGLSLWSVITNAIFGTDGARSLIDRFNYPLLGPGMLWERCAERVAEMGGRVELRHPAVRIAHREGTVRSVAVRRDGGQLEVPVDHLISSIPIPVLLRALDPGAPSDVLEAADRLRFRAMVVVCLIVDRERLFPDNWIYIHSPDVQVGRIQNFKNWSSAMVPDPSTTSLGMEYFCDAGDDLWTMSDADLVAHAGRELEQLGLGRASEVVDGAVIRQPRAYPVYDEGYGENLLKIREYLAGFRNLQTVGRNGLHRYNNQDHSMVTALLAVRNLLGECHDLWQVNTEASYHESLQDASPDVRLSA